MPAKFKVTDAVRDVLRRSKIHENSGAFALELPPEQLDRKLYVEVNKVLEGAGGKWNRKSRQHLFGAQDPRELLGLAVETGEAVNRQQLFQAFYTPEDLAENMAAAAGLQPGNSLLEPSAGRGVLIDAALRAQPALGEICAFDIDPQTLAVLREKASCVLIEDFLESDYYRHSHYNHILMNPPFSNGSAVKHVRHALRYLYPLGTLVAVMPRGWEKKTDKKTLELLSVMKNNGTFIVGDNPDGIFHDAGTEVRTSLLQFVARY